MPWGKVDDQLHDHPKWEALDDRGPGACWVACLSWCSEKLTDGRVPAGKAKKFGTATALRKLVTVGWFHAAGDSCTSPNCRASIEPVPAGHYQMHDYWQCNPTADRELARRAVNAENGSKGAAKREANRQATRIANEEANRSADGYANRQANDDAPLPVPRDPDADICEPPPPENTPSNGGGGGRDEHPSRLTPADGAELHVVHPGLHRLVARAVAVAYAKNANAIGQPVPWRERVRGRITSTHGAAWSAALAANPDVDEAELIAAENGMGIEEVRRWLYRIDDDPNGSAA